MNELILRSISPSSPQGVFKVSERYLTMGQLCRALEQQRVKEMFGSGTACMICPVGDIVYQREVRQRTYT